MQIVAQNKFFDENTTVPRFQFLQSVWPTCPLPETWYFNNTIEMISYHKLAALAQENNLFSDYDLPTQKKEEEAPQPFVAHLKPAISLYILYDDKNYASNLQDLGSFLRPHLVSDEGLGLYSPILYASDFWILNKELVVLNNETSQENATV